MKRVVGLRPDDPRRQVDVERVYSRPMGRHRLEHTAENRQVSRAG